MRIFKPHNFGCILSLAPSPTKVNNWLLCSNKYDFFYLPIDYKNKCNLGYAFVNFTDTDAAAAFYEARHQKRWKEFNSKKVCLRSKKSKHHSKEPNSIVDTKYLLPMKPPLCHVWPTHSRRTAPHRTAPHHRVSCALQHHIVNS